MALVINDRVKENSTTSGTGTLNLAGAVTGFDTFVSGIGDTNTTYYAIFEQGTANWEVGIGTVGDATPDTLARTTVITNSLGNTSKISFAGATMDVFCTLPASKALYLDASGALANATVITDANINASGSASSSTFLRGDNSWTAVSGGSVTDETSSFENYSNITASRTLTMSSGTNYMLIGTITVDDTYTWDVAGTGALTIV